ncbi:MAG: choice-of-anchor B family protein [Saprospiraceae bacterium]|nr:choice-of-anchor B family protein [Saprospiraceae bacterium]
MKKYATLSFLALTTPFLLSAQLQLLGHLPYAPLTLAGCWHYVDNQGGEWALVGTSAGLSIVDLSDPSQPVERFSVPGLANNWREIKTWDGFAYIGSEAPGSGITIVDLRALPDSIYWKVWTGDGANEGLINRSHTVAATDGWLYVFGGGNLTNGCVIADLSDPWNPQITGIYDDFYVHDGYIRGNTLYSSEIYAGQVTVIDVTNKSNPVPLVSTPTPGAFNHNSWLSDDSQTLFTTDEKTNAPLASFDISDLDNITLLDTYYPSVFPNKEVHNVRVLNDFLINPSYGGQLTLVDASRPDNLIETAWVSLGNSLVWDADPYLPSGIVFATAKNEGLFIYQPTYQHAAWLEGQVTDASTGQPISEAKVYVLNTINADTTRPDGLYKTGNAQAGVYTVLAEKPGYASQTIPGIQLQNGIVTTLNIALVPEAVKTAESLSDAFKVFPTLFQDEFTIQLPVDSPFKVGQTIVTLTDSNGKTVWQQTLHGTTNRLQPDPTLPSGAYWLYLQQGQMRSATTGLVKR